jgi:site-specific DNA-cytosine methylase
MNFADSLKPISHHAYGIISAVSVKLEIISLLEKEHKIVARGNPDVFIQGYETLTIDDARALKDSHATRPFAENGRKFFILEVDSMTHEAQNALLKMFEEPNEYAHFFLIISSEESLLPTLRSRLFIVRNLAQSEVSPWNIKEFLASSPADRIALVDKLAADITDGKKSKSAALEFCGSLSKYLRDQGIEKNAVALAALAQTESYLRDRSPSVKQLLEYAALSVRDASTT